MTENRVYNFAAGPSMLPVEVLTTASNEMLNYKGSGMSVMEMSHRSKAYLEIITEAEALLRSVMGIPDNYKVLFLQGGATTQFAMVPMNLLTKNGKADYVCTGNFAEKAYKEAQRFGKQINLAGSTKDENYTRIPRQDELTLDKDADYFYLCTNNTIYGTTWQYIPETGNVPVIADMSSSILSQPVDVSKYGIIFAGAQKNMGPAGLTVVIIREDLVGTTLPGTPTMLDYAIQVKNESMYNTPPCYSIYVCKLVLEWLQKLGGLKEMEKINRHKAGLLYNFLDNSKLFRNDNNPADRSLMNAVFRTGDEELDAKFVKESIAAGMTNLKGHRAVGGMRASIYNAMPTSGVEYLVKFMEEFEKNNSK